MNCDFSKWGFREKDTRSPSYSFDFFHNSRLIRQIQQNKIYKKFRDLTRNWIQIACLTVRHLNHYTRMFSVLVSGWNWMLFMHGWFCPIHLIHQIGRNFFILKKLDWRIQVERQGRPQGPIFLFSCSFQEKIYKIMAFPACLGNPGSATDTDSTEWTLFLALSSSANSNGV